MECDTTTSNSISFGIPGSQDEEICVIEVLPLTRSSRINQNRARKAIELWQHKVDRQRGHDERTWPVHSHHRTDGRRGSSTEDRRHCWRLVGQSRRMVR